MKSILGLYDPEAKATAHAHNRAPARMTGSWEHLPTFAEVTQHDWALRLLDSNLGSVHMPPEAESRRPRAGLDKPGSCGCPHLEDAGDPSPVLCQARLEEGQGTCHYVHSAPRSPEKMK